MARNSLRPVLRALGLIPRAALHAGSIAAGAVAGVLACALVAFTVFGGSERRPATHGSTVSSTLTGSAGISAASRAGAKLPSDASAATQQTPFVAGTVLVGFRAGTSAPAEQRIVRAVGARDLRVIGAGTHVLRLAGVSVSAAITALRRVGSVRYAEPDYIANASAVTPTVPNDPSFGLQWGSQNTGQGVPSQGTSEALGTPSSGTPGADDKASWAWNATTGDPSIVIGETDTGVDYNHPDLAGNIWANPGGVGGCAAGTHGYNVVASTCDPLDDDNFYKGHGTHVAGVMGAVGNNGAGVAGMNWATTILPVKWLDSTAQGTTAQLIGALAWLVTAKQAGVNVRVANDSATFAGTAFSQALSDEIDTLGTNNILFVTAAGNSGENNDTTARYPCSYGRANEICVTASDLNDSIPSWANVGSGTVDLAAPGVSVYSTLRSGYGYLSGGSMAAAQVSGAAALLLASNSSLTTSEVKSAILGNVDPIPGMSALVRTGGRLNVCKAIPGCRQPALATTTQAIPDAIGTSAQLNGTVIPQNTSTSYFFRYSTNQDMSGATSTGSQSAGSGPTSQPVSQSVTTLLPNTTYYFQVVATNAAGTTSGSVLSFSTSLGPQVATVPASSVNGASAVLNGFVNPENLRTTYWFKYSPNQDMSGATTTGSQSAGSGGTGTGVSQPVTGLQPNASYYFQVVASNTAGTKTSSVATFVTSTPPLAITQAAQSIGATSAVLEGSVNPQNSPTTYAFKYSPNADMSGALPLPAIPADARSDNAAHAVSQPLSGLASGTTYYFQVVATNAAAGVRTTIGSVVSFTTLAPPAVIPATASLPPPPPHGGGPPTGSKPPKPSYAERVPSGQTLNSLLAHGLTIRVRCAARCSLTAELLLPVTYKLSRHRIRTTIKLLGKVSKTLTGDRTLQFVITLSHTGRRAVMHLSRVVLTLQLSAIAQGTNAHTTSAPNTRKLRVTLVRSSGGKSPRHARRYLG